MSAVITNDAEQKSLVYFFRRFPHSPHDGYYEIRTEAGEFLSSADKAELSEELRNYREQGYVLVKKTGK